MNDSNDSHRVAQNAQRIGISSVSIRRKIIAGLSRLRTHVVAAEFAAYADKAGNV
jgi:hypothetical protein